MALGREFGTVRFSDDVRRSNCSVICSDCKEVEVGVVHIEVVERQTSLEERSILVEKKTRV